MKARTASSPRNEDSLLLFSLATSTMLLLLLVSASFPSSLLLLPSSDEILITLRSGLWSSSLDSIWSLKASSLMPVRRPVLVTDMVEAVLKSVPGYSPSGMTKIGEDKLLELGREKTGVALTTLANASMSKSRTPELRSTRWLVCILYLII